MFDLESLYEANATANIPDGLDAAVVGICEPAPGRFVAAIDYNKALALVMRREQMNLEDAKMFLEVIMPVHPRPDDPVYLHQAVAA